MLAGKIGFFAPSGFDPLSVGTLVAWYDFSDSATLTLVSSLVSQIANKSGTAPTLTQSTAANRPSLGTLGGRQAAAFNGSSTVLFSNTAVASAGTLFAAFAPTSTTTNQTAAAFSAASPVLTSHAAVALYGAGRGPGAAYRHTGTGGNNTTLLSPSSVTGGAIVASTYTTPATIAVRVNGVARTDSSQGGGFASNQAAASIGAVNVNGTYIRYLAGTVGEVLLYSTVLSAAQIGQVEAYLAARWGVPL